MFFKNLHLFKVETDQLQTLESALQSKKFTPCSSIQPMSYGWVAPVGKDDAPLVHEVNGCLMICAQTEEKVLPNQVVNDALAEKLKTLEEERGSKVRKKERNLLRDEIVHDLMPRAFSVIRKQYAYIDTKIGWMVVNASSASKAEDMVSLLRLSFLGGTFPARRANTEHLPEQIMTGWLKTNDLPDGLEFGNDCNLKAVDDSSEEVIFKHSDLSQDELQAHLDASMQVKKIALVWKDRLSFTLTSNLEIKKLKFLELVMSDRADIEADSEESVFDADFSIMAYELYALIPSLIDMFGGLHEEVNS